MRVLSAHNVVYLILSSRMSHANSSLVIGRNTTLLRMGPEEGAAGTRCTESSWAVLSL